MIKSAVKYPMSSRPASDGDDDDLDGGLDAPGMAVDAIFDLADADGDGQATLGEFRDAMTTMGLDVGIWTWR